MSQQVGSTAVIEHVTQAQVEADPPEVNIVDVPGEPAAGPQGLTEQERQEVEALADELREAQKIYTARCQYEAFKELLDALANDPKPDASRAHVLEGLWSEHYRMAETLHPIVRRIVRPKIAKAALETVLAETRQVLDPAENLIQMEPEFRAALDRVLGVKYKAVYGILDEVALLEGLSIGVDFGSEISNDLYQDRKTIAEVIRESGDDQDMAVLGKAYALARRIRRAEDGDDEGPDDTETVLESGPEASEEPTGTGEEQEGEPTALAERLVPAYHRLPRDARAWMRLGLTLPCELGEHHNDTAEALQNAIENDEETDGYLPNCPDREFLEVVLLVLRGD